MDALFRTWLHRLGHRGAVDNARVACESWQQALAEVDRLAARLAALSPGGAGRVA